MSNNRKKVLIFSHYLNLLNNVFKKALFNGIKSFGLEIDEISDGYGDYLKDDEKMKNIVAIINFEETFDPRNINKFGVDLPDLMKLFEDTVISKKIPIYPPPKWLFYTDSKSYYEDLINDKNNLMLSGSRYIDGMTIKKNELKKVLKNIEEPKIIMKKGYTGEKEGFTEIDAPVDSDMISEIINDFHKYSEEKLDGFNKLPVLIQKFNPIITERTNEYRCFFINGEFVEMFAFGAIKDESGKRKMIPSVEYDDNNPTHKEIRKTAVEAANYMMKKMEYPIFLRIDVSWEDGETNIRHYYVNEIENLDATFYFFIKFDNGKDTRDIQHKLANALITWLGSSLICVNKLKEISKAGMEDIKIIKKLDEKCFGEESYDIKILKSYTKYPSVTFIAKIIDGLADDESINGGCMILTYSTKLNSYEITSICVLEKYRKYGIARQLIYYAFRYMNKKGPFSYVTVHIKKDNIPSLALFHSFGFKEIDDGYVRESKNDKLKLKYMKQ